MNKVHVLFGGDSPEREVSLSSGRAVCEGLALAGLDVVPFEMAGKEDVFRLLQSGCVEFAFIALHGGWGEDGTLQAALDLAGVPFSGSGPGACFCAMDKELSRALFASKGVPHPRGVVLERDLSRDLPAEKLKNCLQAWGDLIVKPSGCGSTVGVTRVRKEIELMPALEEALRYDAKAIVEEFVPGRELTVTVMEEKGLPFALPAVEIVPTSGFYSYESKYTPGATEYLVPAPLENSVAREMARVAVEAHRCLGCRVYSRVDFRLDPEGRLFVLEANTAPGMTATSLVPKAARAQGWSFPELLERIVRESLRR